MDSRAENHGERSSWRSEPPGSSPVNSPNSWRNTALPPSSRRGLTGPRSRKRGRILAAALSLACSFALLILLWQMPGCTSTELVVAIVDRAQDCQVPISSAATADANRLEQQGQRLVGKVHAPATHFAGLTERLKAIPKNRIAVVYLSAPSAWLAEGGASRDQSAVFFWADSLADEPASRPTEKRGLVTLQQLVGELRNLPPEQPKLLLLDLSIQRPDWRIGQLGNWFGDALADELHKVPRLTVITSCAPQERSWIGSDLGPDGKGESAFAHFVGLGLSGAADRDRNRRITMPELYEYLHAHVNAWVWQNRDARGQHPQLITGTPEDRSVAIALRSTRRSKLDSASNPVRGGASARPEPAPTSSNTTASKTANTNQVAKSATATVWRDLDRTWKDLESLQGDPADWLRETAAYQIDPLRWRAILLLLLQADQLRQEQGAELAVPLVQQAAQHLRSLRQEVEADVLTRFESQPFVRQNVVRRLRGQAQGVSTDDTVGLPEVNLARALQSVLPQYASHGRRAVELRGLAEQAACAPLGTRLFSQTALAQADRLRRLSEDRLFVRADVDQIARDQTAVEAAYRRIRDRQQLGQQLRALRNRLLAELPELSSWCAHRVSELPKPQVLALIDLFKSGLSQVPAQLPTLDQLRPFTGELSSLDRISIETLILWEVNRQVEQQLRTWQTVDDASETDLETVRTLLGTAEQSLKVVTETIELRARQLSSPQRQPQVPNWRDLADLLNCPLLPAEYRTRLSSLQAQYSARLEEGYEAADVTKAPGEAAPDTRPLHARWHGLWALHAVSRGLDGHADDQELWELWTKLPTEDHPEFVARTTALGDRIRRALIANRRLMEAESLRSESTEVTGSPRDAIVYALRARETADRLSRCYIDRCAAVSLAGKLNATREWRRHQMACLLVSLAEQYLEDYWKGWYDSAVTACLKGVEDLALPVFQPRIAELQKQLRLRQEAHPGVLASTVVFGSADLKVLPIAVTNQGLPDGEAAFWLDVPTGRGLIHSDNVVRPFVLNAAQGAPREQTFSFRLERTGSPADIVNDVEARPRIFFRGHTWEDRLKAVRIQPQRPVGIQYAYTAAPPGGRVVVEGHHKPVLLFVLDCSGSMNTAVEAGETRFTIASTVFEQTLANLALQTGNNACHVGLLAYGGGIEQVELLNDINLLDREHQQQIIAAWKKLKPDGSTPLFRAISRACDELQKHQTGGTIVAITDGIDGEPDPQNKLFETTSRRLERARAAGTELVMIGFEMKANELQGPDQIEKYRQMKMLAGKFYDARGHRGLDEALRETVRVRPYSVYSSTGRNRATPLLSDVPFGDDRELVAGDYKARFGTTASIDFKIHGGEFLRFQADRARMIHPKPPDVRGSEPDPRQPGAVRFGYRSFKIDPGREEAQFKFSVTHDDETSYVPRPVEILFDVRPVDVGGLRSLEWSIESGHTIPTWRVAVQKWPGHQPAEVHVSWKWQRTPPDLTRPWKKLTSAEPLTVNTLAGQLLTLKVLSAQFLPQSSQARVELQLERGDENATPLMENDPLIDELRLLRCELQPPGSGGATSDWTTRRELIPTEGKLVIEFELPETRSIDEWQFLLTSRKSLLHNATQPPEPLRILKTDQEL